MGLSLSEHLLSLAAIPSDKTGKTGGKDGPDVFEGRGWVGSGGTSTQFMYCPES